MTYPLAYVVNDFFRSKVPPTKSGGSSVWPMAPVSGAQSMVDSVRVEHLEQFRTGAISLLAATNALEEGIDVSACSFVIRYDSVSTTKSHIQGSGRGRSEDAQVFYFVNDPTIECSKAARLDAVAKDTALNTSKTELHAQLSSATGRSATSRSLVNHPYCPSPASGGQALSGEVNFFNCISIFYEYVQVVMQQSFDPESTLFDIQTEQITSTEERRTVLAVRYPSPVGEQVLPIAAVNLFWAGCAVEDVVTPADRLRNLDTWDREKRRAAYIAVVGMRGAGWLTDENKPSARARAETKLVCPVLVQATKISLKNKFDKESLSRYI